MIALVVSVVTFLLIAGTVSLKLTRRWRKHQLPEQIQRHIPKYEPSVHDGQAVAFFGIQRSTVTMISDILGTFVAMQSFVDLIFDVWGLQMDLVG